MGATESTPIHTETVGRRKSEFLRRIIAGLLWRAVKKGRGGIDFRIKKTPIDRTAADGSEKKIFPPYVQPRYMADYFIR